MSSTGSNYRNLSDCTGLSHIKDYIAMWKDKRESIFITIATLHELIDVRDGFKECIGFIIDDINAFIVDICIH